MFDCSLVDSPPCIPFLAYEALDVLENMCSHYVPSEFLQYIGSLVVSHRGHDEALDVISQWIAQRCFRAVLKENVLCCQASTEFSFEDMFVMLTSSNTSSMLIQLFSDILDCFDNETTFYFTKVKYHTQSHFCIHSLLGRANTYSSDGIKPCLF